MTQNTISLQEITAENWLDCINLRLADHQQGFLKSNAYSLVQARYDPACVPLGIYCDRTLIGFVMYGQNDQGEWWILRFMIDARYQGCGYGKAALKQLIDRIKSQPNCSEIFLDYVPENVVAEQFYRSFGFIPTGEIVEGYIIMRLDCRLG